MPPKPAAAQPAPVAAPDGKGPDGCPQEPGQAVSGEQAARCLYRAWVDRNRSLAYVYASFTAADTLFQQQYEPPAWEWQGCGESYGPPGEVACKWFVPDDIHGVEVQMVIGGSPSAGSTVESIEFYG